MVIFNSYATNYQRVCPINIPIFLGSIPINHHKIPLTHFVKLPEGTFFKEGTPWSFLRQNLALAMATLVMASWSHAMRSGHRMPWES